VIVESEVSDDNASTLSFEISQKNQMTYPGQVKYE
jgi:hypothetical protein